MMKNRRPSSFLSSISPTTLDRRRVYSSSQGITQSSLDCPRLTSSSVHTLDQPLKRAVYVLPRRPLFFQPSSIVTQLDTSV
jgi:hypothetical protein